MSGAGGSEFARFADPHQFRSKNARARALCAEQLRLGPRGPGIRICVSKGFPVRGSQRRLRRGRELVHRVPGHARALFRVQRALLDGLRGFYAGGKRPGPRGRGVSEGPVGGGLGVRVLSGRAQSSCGDERRVRGSYRRRIYDRGSFEAGRVLETDQGVEPVQDRVSGLGKC